MSSVLEVPQARAVHVLLADDSATASAQERVQARRRGSGRARSREPFHQARLEACRTRFPTATETGTCSRLAAVAGYVQDDMSREEVERQRALYGPFTQACASWSDATIRTEVDDDEIRAGAGRGRGASPRGCGSGSSTGRTASASRQRRQPRLGQRGRRPAQRDRAAAGRSMRDPAGRAGRTSTSARPTRARRGWCTAGSPR